MIPFATPRPGEVINLLTISRAKILDDGTIRVVYTDGATDTFKGDAANFLNIELGFALNAYREYQKHATGQTPLILTPDNGRMN